MITKVGKSIYKMLPERWEDISVSVYQRLTGIIITAPDEYIGTLSMGMEYYIKIISKFTDLPIEQINNLPMADLVELAKKIQFITVMPIRNKKPSITFKSRDEITYNDFVIYQQLQNDFYNNLHLILPSFIKEELSPVQIGELNIVEAYTAFFFANKKIKKLQKRSVFYLKVISMSLKIEKMMKKIKAILLFQKSLKKQ